MTCSSSLMSLCAPITTRFIRCTLFDEPINRLYQMALEFFACPSLLSPHCCPPWASHWAFTRCPQRGWTTPSQSGMTFWGVVMSSAFCFLVPKCHFAPPSQKPIPVWDEPDFTFTARLHFYFSPSYICLSFYWSRLETHPVVQLVTTWLTRQQCNVGSQ